ESPHRCTLPKVDAFSALPQLSFLTTASASRVLRLGPNCGNGPTYPRAIGHGDRSRKPSDPEVGLCSSQLGRPAELLVEHFRVAQKLQLVESAHHQFPRGA